MLEKTDKIVLFGAAGLVGQNLILLLKSQGYQSLVAIDKQANNLAILRQLHPDVTALEADLALRGDWEKALAGAKAAVMLQAQIGGEIESEFQRNNVDSTVQVLDALKCAQVPYVVHISSSVVNSLARDWYTESKKAQEKVVVEGPVAHCVLRPTLMFGLLDRKHLGWLSRFMRRVPVFPIPGSGRYLRQPLYVMDFCRIIAACLQQQPRNQAFDISGREKIDYIDIIRTIKRVMGLKTPIVRIPYWLFWLLLKTYALIDRNPPFTTHQLEALVTPDEFALIPWWEIFGVPSTPFDQAARETFADTKYAEIELEF
jgi:nucleoside-diphosphate-sugar epimerase